MNLEELRRTLSAVDPNNPADWPFFLKALAALLLGLIVAAAGYKLLVNDSLAERDRVIAEESALRNTFQIKYKKAINLDIYRQQLAEMEQGFEALRRQLPDSTQVPDLLVQITQTGLAHGLEFELFEPKKEKPAEFYAELPISILVSGKYHEIAQFVSDVAGFPRIVTLHDVALKPVDSGQTTLKMSATARTYRYLDEEEQ